MVQRVFQPNVFQNDVFQVLNTIVKTVNETEQEVEGILYHRDLVRLKAETTNLVETDPTSGVFQSSVFQTNVFQNKGKSILVISGFVRKINETVELSELVSGLRDGFTFSNGSLIARIAETVQLGEAKNFARSLLRLISETVEKVENTVRLRVRLRHIDESESINEIAPGNDVFQNNVFQNNVFQIGGRGIVKIGGFVKLIYETLEISELIKGIRNGFSMGGGALIGRINETVQLVESVLGPRTMKRVLNETLEIPELVSKLKSVIMHVNETIQILMIQHIFQPDVFQQNVFGQGNALVRFRDRFRPINETIEIVESVPRNKFIKILINEIEQISEAIRMLRGEFSGGAGSLVALVSETQRIFETLHNPRTMKRILNEVMEIEELRIIKVVLLKVVNETLEISDAILKTRTMKRLIDETEEIIDSINRKGFLRVVINEIIELVESVPRNKFIKILINEIMNIVESVSRTGVTHLKIINEVEQIQESVVKKTSLGSGSESQSVSTSSTAKTAQTFPSGEGQSVKTLSTTVSSE